MKFAIMGAGAMGCLFGGFLVKNRQDVTLVDVWEKHVQNINKNGLYMKQIGGEEEYIKIKATTNANTVGPVDVVIFLVKGTNTDKAIQQCISMINKNTIVLTLQNGIGNVDKISKVVDKKQIAYGVIEFSSILEGPGSISYELANRNVFMNLATMCKNNKLNEIATIMKYSGINAHITEDVEEMIWRKLVINSAFNATCAITGLNIGSLIEQEEYVNLLEEITLEVINVANAKGIKLDYNKEMRNLKELARMVSEHYPSMVQDVAHKRPTEIDFINGAVVREGENLNIPTPVNNTLVRFIKIIENSYEKKKMN